MSDIQQAVFTSARTERMDGYQLVASSEGVTSDQRDELSAWGPAHDSLLNPQSRLGSVNFHRLATGDYCLSKTVPAGAEYSGRNGPRTYTTFMILTPDQMQRFACQPFRVLDAAIAGGYLRVARRLSDTLPCVRLRGRASAALTSILEPLSDPQRRRQVLALAEVVCRGKAMVVAQAGLRPVLDRLCNLLPIACRAELSFSTGLTPSPQRPLQIQPVANSDMPSQTAARQADAALIDLASPDEHVPSGWWAMVDELLEGEQFSDIVNLLSAEDEDIGLGDLSNWSPALAR